MKCENRDTERQASVARGHLRDVVSSFAFFDWMDSPVGRLAILSHSEALGSILFVNDPSEFEDLVPQPNSVTTETKTQLAEYFSGLRQTFTIPLLASGTPFEERVWNALLDIPFGETCSYRDVAQRLNNLGAIRAVGRANGRNPIAILVPCHRVIGADGSLTGYGGQLWRKRWLLDLEANVAGVGQTRLL